MRQQKKKPAKSPFLSGTSLEPKKVRAALEAVMRNGELEAATNAAKLLHYFFPDDDDALAKTYPGNESLSDSTLDAFYASLTPGLPKAKPAAVKFWLHAASTPFLVALLKLPKFSKLWPAAVDRLSLQGKADLAAGVADKVPVLQRLSIFAAHGKQLQAAKAKKISDEVAKVLLRAKDMGQFQWNQHGVIDYALFETEFGRIVRNLALVMPDKGERVLQKLFEASRHEPAVVAALIRIDALHTPELQRTLSDEALLCATAFQLQRYQAVLAERARSNADFRSTLLMSPLAQEKQLEPLLNELRQSSRGTQPKPAPAATGVDELISIVEEGALDEAMWNAVVALRASTTNKRAARAIEKLIGDPRCKARLTDLARAAMAVGDETTAEILESAAAHAKNDFMLSYAARTLAMKFRPV